MTQASISAPELVSKAIHAHWEGVDAGLARLLVIMDSKDVWVANDDEEFFALLARLVDLCEQPEFSESLATGESAARLSAIFALLCTSRFARVLELIDRRSPGLVGRLVLKMSSLGGDVRVFVDLFYERLLVIRRCDLLGHIFTAERASRISASIDALTTRASE